MTRTVHDALASHTTNYEIVRELHAVPPHVTYEVVVDGTRAVCKLATDPETDPTTEARIIEFVGRETTVPVPRILAVGRNYFLAEWHDGVPETPRNDELWARTAGAGMAILHTQTAPHFEETGVLDATSDELLVDEDEVWPETIRVVLEDCREYLGSFGYADVARDALTFVRDHPDAFAGCGHPVLCHGNFVPDHVGVSDGILDCVIDFEHTLVGPAEYDYWRTALPVFEASDRPTLGRAFHAGYESVRALPDGFDRRAYLYRMVNTVSYLKALFVQQQHTEEETTHSAEWMVGYVRETLDSLGDQ